MLPCEGMVRRINNGWDDPFQASTLLYLKMIRYITFLCPREFIYQSIWELKIPPQKSMREWAEYPSGNFWPNPQIENLNQKIFLQNERKRGKSWVEGKWCTWMVLETISEEEECVKLSSSEENWEKKLFWVQELLGSVF
jgi:hypothetical protein